MKENLTFVNEFGSKYKIKEYSCDGDLFSEIVMRAQEKKINFVTDSLDSSLILGHIPVIRVNHFIHNNKKIELFLSEKKYIIAVIDQDQVQYTTGNELIIKLGSGVPEIIVIKNELTNVSIKNRSNLLSIYLLR